MAKKEMRVKCPTCQTEVIWNEKNQYRPFCSERCRLIDLGEWASEGHKIAGDSTWDSASSDILDLNNQG